MQDVLSADSLPAQLTFLLQCLQAVLVGPTAANAKPKHTSKLGKKVTNSAPGAAAAGVGDSDMPPPPSLTLSRNTSAPGAPEAAFNEPGYERQRGTPEGDRLVRYADNGGYEKLREGTLKWAMIDQLKNLPEGFEEAVKSHFRLKRKYIGQLVDGRLAAAIATDSTDSGHATRLTKLWEELQALLAALGESPCDRSAPESAAAAVTEDGAPVSADSAAGGC